MRKIKFRAWDTEVKVMYPRNPYEFVVVGTGGVYLSQGADDDGEMVFEVLRNAIPIEYTGLKDRTGKEIYEGDVVRCWGGEFCQGYWEFDQTITISNMINDCFMMGESEFIKVVGNIYENPELLRGCKT